MSAISWDKISQLSDFEILGFVTGFALVSHAYFKSYQPTLLSVLGFGLFVTVAFVSTLALATSRSVFAIVVLYVKAESLYLATLFSSIGIYRVYFHPLKNIPGDPRFALTKWAAWKTSWNGQLGYYHKEAHDIYGPIVRMGPNWVDFQNPAMIPRIYGANPVQHRKGPFYDDSGEPNYQALQFEKDDTEHARRRRVWDQGFSMKALSEYENDIHHRINQLVDGVAKASSESKTNEVDIELWSSFFSFDVMGDLAFGEGFQMLERGQPHFFLEVLKAAMRINFSQVAWIYPIKHHLIPTMAVEKKFKAFVVGQLQKRILGGSKRRDLFTWLLAEEGDVSTKLTPTQLGADTILIVVAGSDTTSSGTLTWAWYYIATNLHYFKRLQAELDDAMEAAPLDAGRLSRLPFLNAVINETMRLQPPVPQALQRIVPPKGGVYDGVYLPGGTAISVGSYVVQRDTANWAPLPDAFRPDRWIEPEKEIAANKQAFIPFSYGPRSCPGKNLALMEVRLVLAALVPRYNIEPVPGFDRAAFERGVGDYFTIQSPPLPLTMTPRNLKVD